MKHRSIALALGLAFLGSSAPSLGAADDPARAVAAAAAQKLETSYVYPSRAHEAGEARARDQVGAVVTEIDPREHHLEMAEVDEAVHVVPGVDRLHHLHQRVAIGRLGERAGRDRARVGCLAGPIGKGHPVEAGHFRESARCAEGAEPIG